MFLKKINLQGIGPRLVIWTTLLLTISLLSVSFTIYYLLSNSLRQSDKNLIYGLQQNYEKTYAKWGAEKLKEEVSPEFYVVILKDNGEKVLEVPLKYFDHDFEDEDEIAQTKKTLDQIPLKKGWSTILLLSGEEEKDFFQKLEYQLRLSVWKKEWEQLLPLIDNDMLEVYVTPMGKGLWMKIGKSSEDREENLSRVRYIASFVFLPFILISILVSFFMGMSILRPIKKLAVVISEIQNGKRGLRAPIRNVQDEVELLTIEFNSLLDKNEALIDNIKATVDNVAHDLRTPLTRFRMIAESALINGNSHEALKDALSEGLESSDQILQLLNAIMDLAEAESGTMRIKLDTIQLEPMVKKLKDIFEYVAEDKNIQIETQIPSKLFLWGDEVRLLQAFSNIVDNAIKHSPQDSKIIIKAHQVPDQMVEIEFIDFGQGIPQEDLERIWDRLYRGDHSRNTKGLGIGLSVVKAILKVHKGSVSVSSTQGKGSVFRVKLPIRNDVVSSQ
jgi:signal transduction histidine kinase